MGKGNQKDKQNKIIITRKIEAFPVVDIDKSLELSDEEINNIRKKEYDRVYSNVRYWQTETAKASNKAISALFNLNGIVRFNLLNEQVEEQFRIQLHNKENGALKTSLQNVPYRVIAETHPNLSSYIRSSMSQNVFKLFKNTIFDVIKGNCSIPSFKNTQPVPFTKDAIRNLRTEGNDIIFDFIDNTKFMFRFGRDRSNNRLIIEKIISGEYSLCDSTLVYKDKKIFFNIVVSFNKEKRKLDKNVVIGVDLGINVPATVVMVKNGEKIDHRFLGSRETFFNERRKIFNLKKRVQSNLSGAKSGHGRKRKLKSLDNVNTYEKNWVTNENHKYSKNIVDYVLENNGATIQMEDLSGFGNDKSKKFLSRYWSYFQLQQFVLYKAKREGIEVIFINPKNTSITCPKCKCVSKENRRTQQDFKCNECGYEENADIVGAINIARAVQIKQEEEHDLTL